MVLQETRQLARRRALDVLERQAGALLSDEVRLDGWQSGRVT